MLVPVFFFFFLLVGYFLPSMFRPLVLRRPGRQPSHARWISLSFGATQTVAGMLMAVVLIFTVTGERFASLKVCCKTSQRVKFREFVCRQILTPQL